MQPPINADKCEQTVVFIGVYLRSSAASHVLAFSPPC